MDFSEFDLSSQADDLQRRKAIVEALTKRAASPSLLDATMGFFDRGPADKAAEMQQTLAKDSATHQQRYQGQLGGELNSYLAKMQGAPSQPAASYNGSAEGIGPPTEAVAANPREAIVRAMTSQLPEMQAMGKTQMAGLGKPQEWSPQVIGNQLLFTDKQGNTKNGGTFNKADWVDEDKTVNGAVVPGQRNRQDNQWMPRSGSGTTINLDTKGAGKLQDVALKAMEDSRGTVMGVQRQMDAAERVLALAEDPQVISGFGAGAVTGLAALGAKLGLNGAEGVAKTQALMTDLAQKTLDAGQQMKGSFSDNDIKFLKDVAAGSVEYNPETIKHMALLSYTSGHNTLQNALGQYHGASGKAPQGTDQVLPLPKVSYDARISDRPGFSIREGGYLRYDGLPGQAKASQGRRAEDGASARKRISAADFLAGGQ